MNSKKVETIHSGNLRFVYTSKCSPSCYKNRNAFFTMKIKAF